MKPQTMSNRLLVLIVGIPISDQRKSTTRFKQVTGVAHFQSHVSVPFTKEVTGTRAQ